MTGYALKIEMAQNSNFSFFLYFLYEIWIMCLFAEVAHCLSSKNWDGSKFGEKLNSKQNDSNFELNFEIQIFSRFKFFRAKKVNDFGKKTRDPYFEEKIKKKWMVRVLSQELTLKALNRIINSFRDQSVLKTNEINTICKNTCICA